MFGNPQAPGGSSFGGNPPPPFNLGNAQNTLPGINPLQIAQMVNQGQDPLGLAEQSRPAQDGMGGNALLQALMAMGLDPSAELGGLPNMPQANPMMGMLGGMGAPPMGGMGGPPMGGGY